MITQIRSGVLLLLVFGLTACGGESNKGDKRTAAAITEQNKILQQQLDQQAKQTEQNKTSITITGIVRNLSTGKNAVNATVKVKQGSAFGVPVAATNGAFQVDGLAADSDYEIVVHSTTGEFMDRVFFGKTRATDTTGKVYQDLGVFNVAVGVERTFSIRNSATNTPVSNLVLQANSNSGSGSNADQYLHSSVYDAATEMYKITFPENLSLGVYANLDTNNDSKPEFKPEDSSFGFSGTLSISSNLINNANNIYLIDLGVNQKVKIKISLLNDILAPLPNSAPVVNDSLNGVVSATVDLATGQYVIDAVIDSVLTVMIPSFSANGLTYNSSTVQVAKNSSTVYTLTTQGANPYSTEFSFPLDVEKVFDAVVVPYAYTPVSNIKVAAKSSVIQAAQKFDVFYSSPIALQSDSVKLVKNNVIRATKGDASSTDLILAGTTVVETVNEKVEIDTTLSLNKTLLSIKPKTPLESGYDYAYSVGVVVDSLTGIYTDVYNDDLNFNYVTTSASTFSIADIKIDNVNHYTNGSIINAQNTAGEIATLPQFGGSVVMYFPRSIEGLKYLAIRKEQVIQDNVTFNNVENFLVVSNSQINNSRSYAVSLAHNENVVGNVYVNRGTALADGYLYSQYIGEYMGDNAGSNVNTISFSYAFETKDGIQETGIITFPVQ